MSSITLSEMKTELLEEGLVEIDGRPFYAIPDVDQIAPFLMSVVSDGDRWMFISSAGALTAGRRDAAGALFPYDTDDRIHDAAGTVGPVTSMRVQSGTHIERWEPFSTKRPSSPVRRTLYKSVVGDAVIFEEAHSVLEMVFRYRWSSCDRFGFVRSASLSNLGHAPAAVDVIDGLVNILPFGSDPDHHLRMGNLHNAYKRSELTGPDSRLALFTLESPVSDRPEPAEVLRANVVWSIGFEEASVTLDGSALAAFAQGAPIEARPLLTGRRGGYLLTGSMELAPGEAAGWHIVGDVGQDHFQVAKLKRSVDGGAGLAAAIDESLRDATDSLIKIMARADGLQQTNEAIASAHHFANTTYNVMRGGVPLDGYQVDSADFAAFVSSRNRPVAERHADWLAALPAHLDRGDLVASAEASGDPHLLRLSLEYLPFSFSRRHGDPSRPWNTFSIRIQDDDGRPLIYYEGNWRDIFQNWEALGASFPDYLPSIVSVFVNASTADGFNPYRLTRNGIDWETPDPDDPWSNIGYWGDHQIVYLLRLLRAADRYSPGAVSRMFQQPWFSYADVPYRLNPYGDLVGDPKSTIVYDDVAADRTAERVDRIGSDGRLLPDADHEVRLVTLAEKLLVPALAKLSNFVPGGGIWMNTQRPEWNDANNALVGYGLSMVTLCYLRSYLDYLRQLVRSSGVLHLSLAAEVVDWLEAVGEVMADTLLTPAGEAGDGQRKTMMDRLGGAFSRYRAHLYASGLSAAVPVEASRVVGLCDAAVAHLDHTIEQGRRPDGLYHAYNLVQFSDDGTAAAVEHLPEMLEGQVAAIESGLLDTAQQAEVVDALFESAMYRPDQRSFMLYPARIPPSFLEKNVVPATAVTSNPLLQAMIAAGDESLVAADADGRVRFNAELTSKDEVAGRLELLAGDERWTTLVAAHAAATLDTYEHVFRHHSYTGRSGSMYAYEGIGSIYWHMVAKLLVAVQEGALAGADGGKSPEAVQRLVDAYWRVRSGLGFNHSARVFGAVPTDPYSHTPAHAGAQQPGMTGLVKEELLARLAETATRVTGGRIVFDPTFLRRSELLENSSVFQFYDVHMEPGAIELGEGELGATVCQVPVIVSLTVGDPSVEVVHADGSTRRHPGLSLDRETSAAVFSRTGTVRHIRVDVPASLVG